MGYREGDTAYSLYGCPEELADLIREVFSPCAGIVEGEPWVQGDHMLFVINQRPALALTSTEVLRLMNEIVHTPKDRVEIVDSGQIGPGGAGSACPAAKTRHERRPAMNLLFLDLPPDSCIMNS